MSLLNELRRKRIEDVEDYTLPDASRAGPRGADHGGCRGQAPHAVDFRHSDERRKELYMEGDRWFELKRNGCPEWWVIQQSGSTLPVKYAVRRYLYDAVMSGHQETVRERSPRTQGEF